MRLVWTNPALRNLRAIEAYVAKHDEWAAARLIGRIEDAVAQLPDHPALGRPGTLSGTRERLVAGTPYRVAASTITILALFHTRQSRPTSMS